MVRRLKGAGVICFGKTTTPEFGLMPVTEPELSGPTRNPWGHATHTGRFERRLGSCGRGRASCRWRTAATAAARSAYPRPAVDSLASSPRAGETRSVRIVARHGRDSPATTSSRVRCATARRCSMRPAVPSAGRSTTCRNPGARSRGGRRSSREIADRGDGETAARPQHSSGLRRGGRECRAAVPRSRPRGDRGFAGHRRPRLCARLHDDDLRRDPRDARDGAGTDRPQGAAFGRRNSRPGFLEC